MAVDVAVLSRSPAYMIMWSSRGCGGLGTATQFQSMQCHAPLKMVLYCTLSKGVGCYVLRLGPKR